MKDNLLIEIRKAVSTLNFEIQEMKARAIAKNDNRLTTNVLEAQKLLEKVQGMISDALENPEQGKIAQIQKLVNELASLMSGLAGDSKNVNVPIGQKEEGTMLGRTQDMREGRIGEKSKVRKGLLKKPSEVKEMLRQAEEEEEDEDETEKNALDYTSKNRIKQITQKELEEQTPSLPEEPEPLSRNEKTSESYLEFMRECSKRSDSETCDYLWRWLKENKPELIEESEKGRDKAEYPFPKDEDEDETESERLGDKEFKQMQRLTKGEIRDPTFEKLSILKNCFTKAFETGVLNLPSEALYGVPAQKIERTLEQARFEYQQQLGSKYVPRFGKELPSEVEVHLRADKIMKNEPFNMIPIKRTTVITTKDLQEPINVGKMSWKEIHALAKKLGA